MPSWAHYQKHKAVIKNLWPTRMPQEENFANLQAILKATRESLSVNEIGFFQFIELLDEGSGAALLKTTLGHSSGQYILFLCTGHSG